MAEFDVDALLSRFAERAAAVRERGIPPLEGKARRSFIAQAEVDHTDFALISTSEWSVEDNRLVLRIPLGETD